MENFCTVIGDVLAATTGATTAQQTTTPASAPASITTTTAQQTAQPTSAGPITAAAAITGGDVNNPACTSVVNILASCIAATPAFRTLPNTVQASCACYSGTVYNPNGFDGPLLSCANYASTADLAYYSAIASLTGFCESYYAGPTYQASAASDSAITSLSKTTIVIYPPSGTDSFSQTTVSVKPSVGSSLRGGGSWKLGWAVAFVAFKMVLFFWVSISKLLLLQFRGEKEDSYLWIGSGLVALHVHIERYPFAYSTNKGRESTCFLPIDSVIPRGLVDRVIAMLVINLSSDMKCLLLWVCEVFG
jgi:hypothetical protein